ncbi:hypothetical protein Bca101_083278 [Brassica carinata]
MRLRLGERTKRKVGKFSSSSNNLQVKDGSRQRLAVLVIFSTIIYLYQTGALASFIRRLSQGMHRAAVPPPRAHRPAGRGDNDPAAERDSDDSFRLHNFTTPWLPQHRLYSFSFLHTLNLLQQKKVLCSILLSHFPG